MKKLIFLEADDGYPGIRMSRMLQTATPEKREKLGRYRFDIDRKIRLYADILLRLLLSETTGIGFEDIAIETGKTGKPYLAGPPRLGFSVSHTRNAVAVALSDGPVGVDVEKVGQADPELARDIFSENELSWLNSEKAGRDRRFFELWTKKEALLKRDGNGLPENLRTVDVTVSAAPKLLSALYMGEYVVSVCSAVRFSERDVLWLAEAELYDMWRHRVADSDFYGECL